MMSAAISLAVRGIASGKYGPTSRLVPSPIKRSRTWCNAASFQLDSIVALSRGVERHHAAAPRDRAHSISSRRIEELACSFPYEQYRTVT
jgi:hypothetical protein